MIVLDTHAWMDRRAVRSTALGRDFRGDPTDRLIAATALELDAALVTKDDRIRSWKRIVTVW